MADNEPTMAGDPVEAPADNDVTIGAGAETPAPPSAGDQTIDLQYAVNSSAKERVTSDEATIGPEGSEPAQRDRDDQTLALTGDGAAVRTSAKASVEDVTIGPDGAAPARHDETLAFAEPGGARQKTVTPNPHDEPTIGPGGAVAPSPALLDQTMAFAEPPASDRQNTVPADAPEITIGHEPGNERTGDFTEMAQPTSGAAHKKAHDTAVLPGKGPSKGKKSGIPAQVAGYEILGELGRGGMGVVYKARQPGLNRIVALKMILASGHAGAEALARFRIEAEAIALLQHPYIVQVYESGEEDGCPFFSLEYIEGHSLAKQMDGTPQPPRDAAVMVQKLAEGMFSAHQRGIIHRDLKPANILLTQTGVPKITDFGLAKRFEDKDEGQTRDGAIMGTPSYMAPEQAGGKTKHTGPAADIYSLGAILYDMLAGRPPFRGTTLLETLQQVQSLEPIPPKRLQPNVPPDLQTICLKALEKDPQKRYPTAGGLAEDLRRFLAGEPISARASTIWERGWKWAKRRPAKAALIAASVFTVVALLTLGGLWLDSERRAAQERQHQQEQLALEARKGETLQRENAHLAQSQAEQAKIQAKKEAMLRSIAEKNFQRARDAVDDITRVGQEGLANVPNMEKVRGELLRKSVAYYKEFMQEKSDDPGVRWDTARSHMRVADILAALGQRDEAETSYHAALDILGGLEKENPTKLEYQRDLATAAGNFGNLLKDAKRGPEAESVYRQSLQIRSALAAKFSQDSKLLLELAKSQNNLGVLLQSQGKLDAAARSYEESINLLTKLKSHFPDAAQGELARALENLATLERQRERLPAAEKRYLESRTLLGELVSNHAEVAEYRQQLADAHSGLAMVYQAQDRQADADSAYDAALKIRAKAAADFPGMPDNRLRLASSQNNVGLMFLTTGRVQQAEATFAEARKQLEALVKEYAGVPNYQAELAGVYLNLGTTWQSTGRPKDAEDVYRKSLALRGDLMKKHPDVTAYQQEYASTLMDLGTLQRVNNKLPEAEKMYRDALDNFRQIMEREPDNLDYRHEFAIRLNNLGSVVRAQKRPDEAEAIYKQGLGELRKLQEDVPDSLQYAQELGRSLNELGIFYASEKRFKEAEDAWQDAITRQQALLSRHAERAEYRQELAQSVGNLGLLHAKQGALDKAEADYRQSLSVLEEYEDRLPATPAYSRELVNTHTNLASLMQAQNKFLDADKSWLRVLDVRERLVKAFPNVPEYRLETVGTLGELGQRVLQNDKPADAVVFFNRALDHLAVLKTSADVSQQLYACRINLASAYVAQKDHAAAAKTIEEASREAPKRAPEQFASAILANCVQLANADKKLSSDARSDLVKGYGDGAIEHLRHAVQNGFNDVMMLQSDDFNSIRDREDFQTILKGLRKT